MSDRRMFQSLYEVYNTLQQQDSLVRVNNSASYPRGAALTYLRESVAVPKRIKIIINKQTERVLDVAHHTDRTVSTAL
jgi:hypothetical protein